MNLSAIGALVTCQVTFTELFIAATVIIVVAHKYGWRSAWIGSLIGAAAITSISYILGSLAGHLPTKIIDWVSSLLLLGFGLFLLYEFWSANSSTHNDSSIDKTEDKPERIQPLSWTGVSVAAWGMFVEGAEIGVVWLGIAIKDGMITATAGVIAGIIIIGLVVLLLGKSDIFRRIPVKYLDLIAGLMVTGYGIYFIMEALKI